MAVGKLVVAVTLAAVSFLANWLLQPKKSKKPLDDSKTEPSSRGTLLGIMVGYLRIGPVIGWVGGRYTKEEEVSGSGGKGGLGGGDEQKQTIYYEQGWHLLSIGQGRSIRRIYQAGKAIWTGEITPATHPSGTSVSLGKEGRFFVYWGEDGQPVNAALAAKVGASSGWPRVFYLWWSNKRLGTSANWPNLEYEITTEPVSPETFTEDDYFELGENNYTNQAFATYIRVEDTGTEQEEIYDWNTLRVASTAVPLLLIGHSISILSAGQSVLESKVSYVEVVGSYRYITIMDPLPQAAFDSTPTATAWTTSTLRFDSRGFPNQGANPAYTLCQFTSQARPLGSGQNEDWMDMTSLQTISTLLDTENTPTTSLLRSGRSWKDGVASLMQDLGIMFVMDPTTGLYQYKAVRDTDASTEIPESSFVGDDLIQTHAYSVLAADSRVFTYKDSARDFADSTIVKTKDGDAKYGADPNVKSISLDTVVSYDPASRIAARRDSEVSENSASDVDIAYTENPVPADVVTLEGIPGSFRVAGVRSNPDEAKRTLSLIENVYSTSGEYVDFLPTNPNPGETSVVPDISLDLMEPSRFGLPGVDGFFVLRVRGNALSASATVFNSPSDATYEANGNVAACVGGILREELPEDTGVLIEEGPEVELLGEDFADYIENLTGQDQEWRAGQQMCKIDDELFYLRNVTVVSAVGATVRFRLDGLIRARKGSTRTTHDENSLVMIFKSAALSLKAVSWLTAGSDLFAKTIPYNSVSAASIEQSPKASLEPYQGGGYRPLSPANAGTEDGTSAWLAGGDAELRWDYKNATSATGAGVGLSDEPSVAAPPEGFFLLTIKTTGGTVVREETLLLPAYTYANADIVSDFGGEPTMFDIEVVESLNGLTSAADSARINRE